MQPNIQDSERIKFVPEFHDLICPPLEKAVNTQNRKAKHYDLMNICMVIEFVETDLDSLLKHQIEF